MASVRLGGEDSVGVALQAISDLRNAGLRPDVVLIPHGLSVRPKLHQHPAFTWARAPVVFDEGHRELGRLDGLPVYETVWENADHMLVADLAAAVRLVERRAPGMTVSLRAEVRDVDVDRAEKLLQIRGESATPANVSELVTKRVELMVAVDDAVEEGPRGGDAVVRITL
jgi:hypothetical protein